RSPLRFENPNLGKLTKADIRDLFPEEQLMAIPDKSKEPCYADYANYLTSHILPFRSIRQEKQKCVVGTEAAQILRQCHSGPLGGHHGIATTINELDELRLNAYESSISYKERIKRWHYKRIKVPTEYEKGDKVLLFNSRLRLFPGKLKSRWYGPFSVSKDINGAIKLYDENGSEFIVNKQRVKPYQKDALNVGKDDDIILEDEGGVTCVRMVFVAFSGALHLEEIHVTWAHLEKKQTRLRLYTKSFGDTMHTERGDCVPITKRRHQDFHIDGVTDLATASEHPFMLLLVMDVRVRL
ncbi:hypothetical protein Tco_0668118, partial [Tanacetum coccineum]